MTPSPRAARPAFVEPLEGRQLFAAFVVADVSRLIFNDPAGGAVSAARSVTLRNTGNTALTIPAGGVTLGGANPFQFRALTVTRTTTVAAGGSLKLSVNFAPSTAGVKSATLVVQSNAANAPAFNLTLRGLGTTGLGGSNEPSLQRILDTYQIPVNVGDNDPAESTIPIPSGAASDEVAAQMFKKAGAGSVTVTPIALFSDPSDPGAIVGWYTTSTVGGATSKRQLFTVPRADVQTLNPRTTGSQTFDPGSAAFGLYSTWPVQANRTVFSEDFRNTFIQPASKQRMFTTFPLKNADGSVVPNAYVVGNEEAFNNDQQDAVFIVRNVVPLAAGQASNPPTPVGATVFQAESGVLVGAGASSANGGFTGGGYADFANNAGDSVRWAVNRSAAGTATLTFRYANGSTADRPLELKVNGVIVRPQLSFAATGSWTTWRTVSVTVSLASGANAVQLSTIGFNGPNLDSMTVA